MNNTRFGGIPILAVLLLMIISAAVAGGSVWYWQTHLPKTTSADPTQADALQAQVLSLKDQISSLQKDVTYDNNTTPASTEPTASGSIGTIQGKLSFPSESIPSDMEICAENQSTHQETCTKEKTDAGKSYKLNVPSGTYHVFARSASFNPNYKAFYSEFVTCGLQASCLSHQPVDVMVTAAKTVDGVDPQDWYNVAK